MTLDKLPDFGIYSDQLIDLIPMILERPEVKFTSSMINNYVKRGLVPRPVKKKYHREAVICVLFIAFLKDVFSLDEIEEIFKHQPDFNRFYQQLKGSENDGSLEALLAKAVGSKQGVLERIYHETNTPSRTP